MRERRGEGMEEPTADRRVLSDTPHTHTPHEIQKVKKEGEREVGREEERMR